MDKKEKDFLKQVYDKTEEVPVPDSLKPENIEKLIQNAKPKKVRKWKHTYNYGLAAACVALCVSAVVFHAVQKDRTPKTGESGYVQIENEEWKTAESYEQIKEYLQASEKQTRDLAKTYGMDRGDVIVEETKMEDMSGGNFSQTNLRQEGVGEGDIVKTDGRYLYVLKSNGRSIEIVDVQNRTMKSAANISLGKEQYIHEFYLEDEKLVVLYSDYENEKTSASADVYDVSNPEKPVKKGSVSQSGNYHTSRLVDGYLYVLSNFWVNANPGPLDTYIPAVNNHLLREDCIYLPPTRDSNSYTVISAIKLSNPNEMVDKKAILGNGGQVYVSNKNIYLYETVWSPFGFTTSEKTCIRKISYENGKLKAAGQGTVKGYINDSFSIDEYEGNLRVVTTVSEKETTSNGLYILNGKLSEIGKIENLAKDERIYSARFMGKTGYFVTFKQVDPLFSVDLSDPKKPEIIGSLKIPGFSSYLHPYGDGMLLGIGQAVDEEAMITDGVKLSMFDISDPSNVKEVDQYVIKGSYGTEALYNYKAVMVSLERNMIGFDVYGDEQTYLLFSYDKGEGFKKNMEVDVSAQDGYSSRGLYSGNTLYVVKGGTIQSFDLNSHEKIDDLVLSNNN